MNPIAAVLLCLLSYMFGAANHEADIIRNCELHGNSRLASWIQEIDCTIPKEEK